MYEPGGIVLLYLLLYIASLLKLISERVWVRAQAKRESRYIKYVGMSYIDQKQNKQIRFDVVNMFDM